MTSSDDGRPANRTAEWAPPMLPPPAGPAPAGLKLTLPPGVESAVVVGPDDLLVVRVSPTTLPGLLQQMVDALEAGAPPGLKGRILLVAADQIGVARL